MVVIFESEAERSEELIYVVQTPEASHLLAGVPAKVASLGCNRAGGKNRRRLGDTERTRPCHDSEWRHRLDDG
jgi:hypothetical protein